MSNTFMKKGLRGFTLIELLVVIAIIGLLSTVIAGPVQTGLKKGRDAKKIGDMKQIQSALAQYSADNRGLYPATLSALAPSYLATTSAMLPTASGRDKIMYVTYADTAGNIVSYHLGVALENQNVVLQADADCQNGSAGGAYPSCSTAGGIASSTNWASATADLGNPVATTSANDFGGAGSAEAAGQTCTNTLSTCIYDIVPQ
jgi:general secretion pathway protein G